MNLYVIAAVTVMLASCNDSKVSQNPATPSAANTAPAANVSGCYRQVIARDSFFARLQQSDNFVTGQLLFDNFEKDASMGQVSGRLAKDIMRLLYSFQSEGTNSLMEVYFKLEGDHLIRGIGEMKMRGDTTVFADPSTVQFPAEGTFVKIPCDSAKRL